MLRNKKKYVKEEEFVMKEWNLKKGLWTALYAVLYAVMTAVVCVLGAIHPVMFVCYQVTAAVLVSALPWVSVVPQAQSANTIQSANKIARVFFMVIVQLPNRRN